MADISKITLPSGNTYDIKDATAREMISGGVSFNIAWDGTSAPTVANIPAGVVVSYNGTSYTGTLAASDATAGAFYLVKSSTTPSGDVLDIYDEYVPVGSDENKTWEKIGDTKLNLTDVVTDVTLNKSTDTVLGTGTTFTVTDPTITNSLSSNNTTGTVSIIQSVSSTTTRIGGHLDGAAATIISNGEDEVSVITGYPNPTKKDAIGASSTFTITQPTIALSSNTSSATGRVQVVTGISSVEPDDTDLVNAVTGYANPTTANVATSVTPTTQKLATTTVTGVTSSTTTASKATAATSQTTATGAGTTSTTNTDWLKGVSVSNETLVIGAATMNTQTTTQHTFSDVTVPIKASSATTVATGSTTTSGSGANIVTNVAVGDTVAAITALGTPTTDSVLGADTGFGGTPTTTYLGATASGANTEWNSKDTVAAITALGTPAADTVLGADTGFTMTNDPLVKLTESSGQGTIQVITGVTPTSKYLKSTASGGAVSASGDNVTAITSATLDVTKGNE